MMYILRVYEDGAVYEYEYGNEAHAREHMNAEKAMCILTEYKDGNDYLIDVKAERK